MRRASVGPSSDSNGSLIFLHLFYRESRRKIITEDMVFLTRGQRFQQVFGPCGFLHFLSPFLPFECPKIDEGYRRIITYNSDFVVNGVVVPSNDYNDSGKEK